MQSVAGLRHAYVTSVTIQKNEQDSQQYACYLLYKVVHAYSQNTFK